MVSFLRSKSTSHQFKPDKVKGARLAAMQDGDTARYGFMVRRLRESPSDVLVRAINLLGKRMSMKQGSKSPPFSPANI